MATTNFVDGQTVIEASWLNDVDEAVYNPASITLPATSVINTPAGSIAAVTVQAAINELDTEKQPLDNELTALATATAAADKIPYFTGTTTAGTLTWNSASALANGATTISSNTVIKTAIDAMAIATQVAPSTSGNVLTSNGSTWISKSNKTYYSATGTGGITSAGTALAITSTTIPLDNTIPQNTEGAAILDVTITCAVGDVIEINGYIPGYVASSVTLVLAVFVDSVADAIAASSDLMATAGYGTTPIIKAFYTATATSHTFKIRGSVSSSTFTANASVSGATLGGKVISYITAKVVA